MPIFYRIVGEDGPKVWGLSPEQRIDRVLRKLLQGQGGTPGPWTADTGCSSEESKILLLRSDYLLDERVIEGLIRKARLDLVVEAEGVPVAALVAPERLTTAEKILAGQQDDEAGLATERLEKVGTSISRKLRKVSPPFAIRLTKGNISQVEHHLFNEAYKGITDLVTKWLWPIPAEHVVRFCANHGIRPNHVTAMSWVLAILAGILFYAGYLGMGLVLGWVMTFLDTVDGKLARVTVDSSPFGHLFDHVLDVIHPPLWYLAWGLGLSQYQPVLLKMPVMQAFWLLLAAYIVGRVVEVVFKKFVAGFSIFIWQPVDSINRLIIARRNPCLILLTLGLVFGRPDLGFEAVTLWMLLSTLFLVLRLAMALVSKKQGGALRPWLDQIDPKSAQGVECWFITPASTHVPRTD